MRPSSAASMRFREIRPEFTPESLLDVGAGPGTATGNGGGVRFADGFTPLDANGALGALALDLGERERRGCATSVITAASVG